jgi:hypothetical protein
MRYTELRCPALKAGVSNLDQSCLQELHGTEIGSRMQPWVCLLSSVGGCGNMLPRGRTPPSVG